jgi:hypothetical protein
MSDIAHELKVRPAFSNKGKDYEAFIVISPAERDEAVAEIERLGHLAIDLMSLLEEMPIKHPQQAERRAALRLRFDVQQTTEGK